MFENVRVEIFAQILFDQISHIKYYHGSDKMSEFSSNLFQSAETRHVLLDVGNSSRFNVCFVNTFGLISLNF